ncbi:MAG: hypothetical protein M1119_10805 [Firmicutes bacterium]|nr:hypothetical protein [Bacillota bacterium]
MTSYEGKSQEVTAGTPGSFFRKAPIRLAVQASMLTVSKALKARNQGETKIPVLNVPGQTSKAFPAGRPAASLCPFQKVVLK